VRQSDQLLSRITCASETRGTPMKTAAKARRSPGLSSRFPSTRFWPGASRARKFCGVSEVIEEGGGEFFIKGVGLMHLRADRARGWQACRRPRSDHPHQPSGFARRAIGLGDIGGFMVGWRSNRQPTPVLCGFRSRVRRRAFRHPQVSAFRVGMDQRPHCGPDRIRCTPLRQCACARARAIWGAAAKHERWA